MVASRRLNFYAVAVLCEKLDCARAVFMWSVIQHVNNMSSIAFRMMKVIQKGTTNMIMRAVLVHG